MKKILIAIIFLNFFVVFVGFAEEELSCDYKKQISEKACESKLKEEKDKAFNDHATKEKYCQEQWDNLSDQQRTGLNKFGQIQECIGHTGLAEKLDQALYKYIDCKKPLAKEYESCKEKEKKEKLKEYQDEISKWWLLPPAKTDGGKVGMPVVDSSEPVTNSNSNNDNKPARNCVEEAQEEKRKCMEPFVKAVGVAESDCKFLEDRIKSCSFYTNHYQKTQCLNKQCNGSCSTATRSCNTTLFLMQEERNQAILQCNSQSVKVLWACQDRKNEVVGKTTQDKSNAHIKKCKCSAC